MFKKHRILYIVGFAGLFLAFFWFFYRFKNLNSKGLRRVLRALQMAFIAGVVWIATLLPTFAKTDDPSFGVYGLQPSTSIFWPRKSGQCGKPPSGGRPNQFRPKVDPYRTAPNLVDQGVGAAANPAGAGNGGGDGQFDESCPVPKTGKKSNRFQNPNSLNQPQKRNKKKSKKNQEKTEVSPSKVSEFAEAGLSESAKKKLTQDRKLFDLARDPRNGMISQQSFNEAESIIQAQAETGLFSNMARPNPRKHRDIDFLVFGSSSYDVADIKKPVSFFDARKGPKKPIPQKELDRLAKNLGANSIAQKQGSERCLHILDLKDIQPWQKESYKANFFQGAREAKHIIVQNDSNNRKVK